jgi:hypothetical protein
MKVSPWAPPTDPAKTFADMSRRFWLSLALAVPLVILAMGRHIPSDFLRPPCPPASVIR